MKHAAVVLLLSLAACSQSTPGVQPSAGAPSFGPARTETPSPTTLRALGFTAPEARSGTVKGQDFAGKDVAVWLWAPW